MQRLVLIGVNLDADSLQSDLKACLCLEGEELDLPAEMDPWGRYSNGKVPVSAITDTATPHGNVHDRHDSTCGNPHHHH